MDIQHHSILTTAGAEYFALAIATGTPVIGAEFSLAVGDGGGQQYEPLADQTSLVGEKWRGKINDIFSNENNASQVVIEGIVPTNVGGWFIREWGIYNKDGVLIAVGSMDDTYKSLLASGVGKQIIIQAILDIDNAAILELVVDDSIVVASKKYVDDALAHIEDEIVLVDERIRNDLASSDGAISVDHVHVKSDTSVSFRKFLTVKDGSVDATQALTDALTSGFTVEIPHDYVLRLDSANIPTISGTTLVGQYGSRPTILMNHTDTDNPQFNVSAFNVFSNIRFRYPNQKLALSGAEIPIAYGALFDGTGYFAEFSNLDIGNTYYGFKLGNDNGSCSKVTINNIIGSPIRRGLSLERCLDIPRISDLHWNYNYLRDYLLPGENYTYDDTLKTWMHNNAEAFQIGRCDFGTFFRLFSYGYWKGIYLRSERYTGSAENCRFVGCDQDMAVHPIWLQNWENRVSVLDCKLVGAVNSGMARKDNSYNVIFDNGKANTTAVIDGVDFSYCSTNGLVTGTNTTVTNCKFQDYGSQSGSQGNGILQTADRFVSIDNTVFNGSAGNQTRAVFSNVSTQPLTLGDGVSISGATLASYDWRTGPVQLAKNARLGGSPGHNGISFISNVPKTYPCEFMPTSGNYFKKGDFAEMTKPVIRSGGGLPEYVVKGWIRLTEANSAGTNHVLGTDWAEDRSYFNGVS